MFGAGSMSPLTMDRTALNGLESAIRGSGFVHGPLAGQEQERLVPVELSLRDQEGPGLHRAAMNLDA